MSLSNVGKAEILSWFFRRSRMLGTTPLGNQGDHGMVLDGSGDPALAIILIKPTVASGFYTEVNGRPNPTRSTVGEIAAAYPGSVINPTGNYTGNLHKLHPDWWDIEIDPSGGEYAEIRFDPTHLPLLTATAALADLTGYILAMANNVTTARVIDVVQFNQSYSVAINQQFNITNFGLSIL